MKPIPLLIPVHNWVSLSGVFRWPARCVLAGAAEADRLPLGQLAADLRRLGQRPRCAWVGRVRRRCGSSATRASRARSTTTSTSGPRASPLRPPADAAAYYAVQTVRETAGRLRADHPGLRHRRLAGLPPPRRLHDCSRGKVPTACDAQGAGGAAGAMEDQRASALHRERLCLPPPPGHRQRLQPLHPRGDPLAPGALQAPSRPPGGGAGQLRPHGEDPGPCRSYRHLSEMPDGDPSTGSELDRWDAVPHRSQVDPVSGRALRGVRAAI